MNLVTSGNRDRRVFVGDLTRKEFREKMEAGTIKAAIIPTAATEQHNEHLEMIHGRNVPKFHFALFRIFQAQGDEENAWLQLKLAVDLSLGRERAYYTRFLEAFEPRKR